MDNYKSLVESIKKENCNSDKKILTKQMKTEQHQEQKIFKCDFCNKIFDSKKRKNRHTRIVHEGVKQQCKLCNKGVFINLCTSYFLVIP